MFYYFQIRPNTQHLSNNNSNKLSEEEEEEKEDNATRLTPNTSTIGKEFPEDSVIP